MKNNETSLKIWGIISLGGLAKGFAFHPFSYSVYDKKELHVKLVSNDLKSVRSYQSNSETESMKYSKWPLARPTPLFWEVGESLKGCFVTEIG